MALRKLRTYRRRDPSRRPRPLVAGRGGLRRGRHRSPRHPQGPRPPRATPSSSSTCKGITGPRLHRGEDEEGARIGALATLAEIATEPGPAGDAIPCSPRPPGRSPRLSCRNMGTIGGNICQEPRCWYYRYPDNRFHCLRKGGGECNALDGREPLPLDIRRRAAGHARLPAECPGNVEIPRYLASVRAGDLDGAAADPPRGQPDARDHGQGLSPLLRARLQPRPSWARPCRCGRSSALGRLRPRERRSPHAAARDGVRARRSPWSARARPGLAAAFYLRRAGHEVQGLRANARGGRHARLRHPRVSAAQDQRSLKRSSSATRRMGIVFETRRRGRPRGAFPRRAARPLRRGLPRARRLGQADDSDPRRRARLDSGLDFLADIQRGKRQVAGPRRSSSSAAATSRSTWPSRPCASARPR